MAIDASIYNLVRAPDISPLIQAVNNFAEMRRNKPFRDQAQAQGQINLGAGQQEFIGKIAATTALNIEPLLASGDAKSAMQQMVAARMQLQKAGIDPPPSPILDALQQGDIATASKLNGAAIQRMQAMGLLGKQQTAQPYAPTYGRQGDQIVQVGTAFNPASGRYESQVVPPPEGVSLLRETPEQESDRKLREAQGKSDIKVDEAGRSVESKTSATRREEYISSGIQSAEAMASTNRALELLDLVKTGGFAAAQKRAGDILGATPANLGELNAILGTAMAQQLKATFGGTQITDSEREFLQTISASIKQTGTVNERILRNGQRLLDLRVRRGIRAAQANGDDASLQEIQGALNLDYSAPAAEPIRDVRSAGTPAAPQQNQDALLQQIMQARPHLTREQAAQLLRQ